MPENSLNTIPKVAEISPAIVEVNEEAVQSPGHVRKKPAWMEDYDVSGIEDLVTHFALFSYCDPTTFESGQRNKMAKGDG